MVKTAYPVIWKFSGQWTMIVFGLMFFIPMHMSVTMGHWTWKRGKVPRLANYDSKYLKHYRDRGAREKMLYQPAFGWNPNTVNAYSLKNLKNFLYMKQYV